MQSGMVIGNYVLREKLGEGAFGEVWKASHRDIEEWTVALKIPKVPEYLSLLKKEANFQHELDHPSIVKILDLNLQCEPPHLAMEFVDGKSLRKILRENGALENEEVMRIFREVCHALAHAHAKGIVHRDLKPENILLNRDNQVKVTDFGLSKFEIAGDSFKLSVDSIASVTDKDIVGTLDYMSPEQRQGLNVDHRTDIYSLGLVFFEMLTGKLPMGHGDLPSDYAENLQSVCDRVFKNCCARMDQRYENIAEVVTDLKNQNKRESSKYSYDEPVIDVTTISISKTDYMELTRLTNEIDSYTEDIKKQRDIVDQMHTVRLNIKHLKRKEKTLKLRKIGEQTPEALSRLEEIGKDLESLQYRMGALQNELAMIETYREKRTPFLLERRELLDRLGVSVALPYETEKKIVSCRNQAYTIKVSFKQIDQALLDFKAALVEMPKAPSLLKKAKAGSMESGTLFNQGDEIQAMALYGKLISKINGKIRSGESALKSIDFTGAGDSPEVPRLDSAIRETMHNWSKATLNPGMTETDSMITAKNRKLAKRLDDLDELKFKFNKEKSFLENEIDELIIASETATVNRIIGKINKIGFD